VRRAGYAVNGSSAKAPKRPPGVVGQILSFGAGEGLARGLNWGMMAMLPLLLNNTEEYGRVGLIVSIELLVTNVSLLGMDRAVLRFYAKDESPGKLLMTVLSIWAAFAWIPLAAALALYFSGREVFFGIPVAPHLLLMGLIVALYNLNFLCICIGRARHDLTVFLRFRLLYTALKFVCVLSLAALAGNSFSYIAGFGIAALAMLAFAVPFLRARAEGPVERAAVFQLLQFGWPFVFHIVSGNILSQFSRFFLEAYSTTKDVGIFTLAYTLGGALYVGYAALGTYFEPRIYNHANDLARCEKWLAFYTYACLAIATAGGAALLLLFPYVTPYLHADYGQARPYIAMVMGTILLNPLYLQGNYRLTAHKKSAYIALASFLSACLIMALNYLLIPAHGIWGAAMAMYIANLGLSGMVLAMSIRTARVPLRELRSIPAFILCPLAATAAVLWAGDTTPAIVVLLAVSLVCGAILFRSLPVFGARAT